MAKLTLADYLMLGKMGFTRKEILEMKNEEPAPEQEIVSSEQLTITDEVKNLITSLQNDINGIKGELQRQNIRNDSVPETNKDDVVSILGSVINPGQNGE